MFCINSCIEIKVHVQWMKENEAAMYRICAESRWQEQNIKYMQLKTDPHRQNRKFHFTLGHSFARCIYTYMYANIQSKDQTIYRSSPTFPKYCKDRASTYIINYYSMIHLTQAIDSSKTRPVVHPIRVLNSLYQNSIHKT